MTIPTLKQFTATSHCLKKTGTWRESVHVFDDRTAQAIRAALASGRPLLVRGEPGTGKSQLARAAAKVMGRKFLSHVVDAHTEIQDLWYRFDAVSRLGQAQVLSATAQDKNQDAIDAELDPEQYLSPGILWWAFDWKTADEHSCKHPLFMPDADDPGNEQNGVVLLLDEIDKADADLPNSLLETLDNGKFTVPWLRKTVGVNCDGETVAGDEKVRPLVVITTNEDRQLPGAFIRRCMVLDLRLPKNKDKLVQELKDRAAFHFPKQAADAACADQAIDLDVKPQSRFHDDILNEAAEQLYKDRQQANSLGVTPPGQAEYLDMLRVLDELAGDDQEEQARLLAVVKEYALKKYPGMQREAEDKLDGDRGAEAAE